MSANVVFTGGGTGGHIYPGLAVADEFREICKENKKECSVFWIGSSKGMDRNIVEKSGSADKFYGIPSGKLRRYFSFENFIDFFKIIGGTIASFFLLLKLKPAVVFSKGGFVSVPPCFAAKILSIPVFTHECDFSPGLATRLNSKFASKILLSYKETENYFGKDKKSRLVVTGNPVRPVFYTADKKRGLDFLQLGIENSPKPILFVAGGSSGAKQINELVTENLDFLCKYFIVVHQTGGAKAGFDEHVVSAPKEGIYKHYPFIYGEMPDVLACADVILSRAGANSLWECAVLGKPMVLVPLCGASTRGDQVENAAFFEKAGAALVLVGEEVSGENLKIALEKMLDPSFRKTCGIKAKELTGQKRPARIIGTLVFNEVFGDEHSDN